MSNNSKARNYAEVACQNSLCQRLFVPTRWWQKFCSADCRIAVNEARRAEALKMMNQMDRIA